MFCKAFVNVHGNHFSELLVGLDGCCLQKEGTLFLDQTLGLDLRKPAQQWIEVSLYAYGRFAFDDTLKGYQ